MAKLKKLSCATCGKPIYRSMGRFHEAVKFDWRTYCSRKCECQYKRKRKKLICENCGKLLERTPHAISPHNYCSQSCAAISNNKKRPERNALKIKCLACGKLFKKWVVGNKKYCSMKCRIETERYKPDELLEIIKNMAKKLGRTPGRREFSGGVDKADKVLWVVERRCSHCWPRTESIA